MGETVALPKVYRPLGARMVSAVAGGVLSVMLVFLWVMLPAHVKAEFGWFQRGTLLAFFAAVLVVLYGIFRTRVMASERGLSVTNGYRRHDFYWAEVVTISLSQHRPWAIVDLTDGSTVSLMALQSADGPRANRSAKEISGLINARSTPNHDS